MQGFALAIKAGVTKSDFDDLVGIHPTDAEAFVQMSVERRDVSKKLITLRLVVVVVESG